MVEYAVVLAHQGGWDEFLLVAAPVAIFVVLLRIANARAAALEEADQADPAAGTAAEPAVHGPAAVRRRHHRP